jgi:hypothetical protein
MKTAPKPPIHLCYASVEIRTPRACSTIAAPVYAVPTTLVKLKTLNHAQAPQVRGYPLDGFHRLELQEEPVFQVRIQ